MKDFLEVVKTRKTIRSFSKEPVLWDTVREIVDVASYAPTNCNQQLQNFIFVDDPATKERLIKEAACNTLIRRAPALLVITYDGWNYKEAIQGGSLMLGHLMLAATYYGLHASPLNSYGSDRTVKQILKIPDRETICCFVTLGHPDEKAMRAPLIPRRPVEETLHRGAFHSEIRPTPPFTYNPDDWTLDELRAHQRYYCRKTTAGKEMDLAGPLERELVRTVLRGISAPIVDLFSYDGSYLSEFPDGARTAVDLTPETSAYTAAAVDLSGRNSRAAVSYALYDEHALEIVSGRARTVTSIYKLERLPRRAFAALFRQARAALLPGGECVIVARKTHVFWFLFLDAVRFVFGNDIRRTGIYSFFGPYRPLSRRHTVRELRRAGFTDISWSGYFLIPAFIPRLYEIGLQYLRSDGATYLHRDEPRSAVLGFLKALLRSQGLSRCGALGSVVVIRCRKPNTP